MHRQRMPLSKESGRDLEQVVKLGRGTLPFQDSAMQKRILLVQPTDQGWAVSFRGLPLGTMATESEAVEAAKGHARDRYGLTGEPIGVVLRLACGSEVLVAEHD